MTRVVDLNGDLGESFGVYKLGDDAWMLATVTSVSVACGYHAGDPMVMRDTVRLATERGLAIGAHPGLPDLQGFGRRELAVTPDEVYTMVAYQVGALIGIAACERAVVRHVKPHGALYNMANRDPGIAMAINAAVKDVDPDLALFAPAASDWARCAMEHNIRVVEEGFADRRYLPDGRLVPRNHPDARVPTPEAAASQALRMVMDGKVVAIDGTLIDMPVDTLCIHGDSPTASAFAATVRVALEEAGVKLVAYV